VPVRVHVKEQAADFKRYSERYAALWTPTILELDADGVEQHRIEGFLPADEFLAQLALGLAHAAFKRQDYAEAARRFEEVLARHPDGEAAAEALYWSGAARYKATGDSRNLTRTAEAFAHRFQDTPWAKKASVWAKRAA
jgi:TolA-binding protein